jgi:FMN reductase
MTERTLAVVSAGLSQPSSTRLLADKLATATVARLADEGFTTKVVTYELRDYAQDIMNNMLTGFANPRLEEMIRPSPRSSPPATAACSRRSST